MGLVGVHLCRVSRHSTPVFGPIVFPEDWLWKKPARPLVPPRFEISAKVCENEQTLPHTLL
jgi:hypothetical protein